MPGGESAGTVCHDRAGFRVTWIISGADHGEPARIAASRKTGREALVLAGQPLKVVLSDFWSWSRSDLLDNTERGVLAEFIVATALGIPTAGVRDGSAAWDLTMPDGIRIEVKSAAYLQTWGQKKLSRISFSTAPARAWDSDCGEFAGAARRQADIYVFALLAHTDKATVNPLELDQWKFYVVPTAILNQRSPTQRSISLTTLKTLTTPIRFEELQTTITVSRRQGPN